MKPLSARSPVLYFASVSFRRLFRRLERLTCGRRWAGEFSPEPLPYRVVHHRSLLLRRLQGADQELQRNKVRSLRIASGRINGVLVRPQETFSFWKLVGKPSESRGFPPGLQLSFGKLTSMPGGGLCQLSNLLHWMVLHTPMVVTERHRHGTDPFPDHRRTVPFGTGATVFYNYLDLCFHNPSSSVFEISAFPSGDYLNGEIRSRTPLPLDYSIEERGHRFVRSGEDVYRENELWKVVTDRSSGSVRERKLVMKNRCRVLYEVDPGVLS